MSKNKILRLILGDQLNINHSWFSETDQNVTYVLMEIKSETNYAHHHIQKVIGFFAAMQAFAAHLKSLKHQVIYIKLNDENNLQSFDKNLAALFVSHDFGHFEYQLPDEYRVDEHLSNFTKNIKITHQVYNTEHFYTERNELGNFFKGKKTYLMESFYRYMRKKHQVLVVNGDEPLHGQWNFDEENREKLPKDHHPIAPFLFSNNVVEIEKEIEKSQYQNNRKC
jgi:deoxyribodipyrimidine photolyase-related protein